MSGGLLPSQRPAARIYSKRARAHAEGVTGKRIDDAINVTWLRARFAIVEAVCTPIQVRSVKFFILCGGNCREAEFRGGLKRDTVSIQLRLAVKKVRKHEADHDLR